MWLTECIVAPVILQLTGNSEKIWTVNCWFYRKPCVMAVKSRLVWYYGAVMATREWISTSQIRCGQWM